MVKLSPVRRSKKRAADAARGKDDVSVYYKEAPFSVGRLPAYEPRGRVACVCLGRRWPLVNDVQAPPHGGAQAKTETKVSG